MPFLSVIIPTFNSGHLLAAALQSLASQSFRDFEVVVIDGLSTDNTKEVFDRFRSQLPATTWISEKDKGIYDALNKGLRNVKGEWIYILGSDDKVYDQDVFKKTHEFISQHPVDVIYGNVMTEAFGGGIYAGKFDRVRLYNQNICHQAIFFKRSVFDLVGSFSYTYQILADWEHNLRWFLSDRLRHEYFDIIVADYAHEGASSGLLDMVFFRDRDWNYAMSGRRTLPFKAKVWHVLKVYKGCLRDRNFFRLISRIINTPAIILGV